MNIIHNNATLPIAQAGDINYYFADKLKNIVCDEMTKNYIIGIFSKYKTSYYDLSKNSITIQYGEALLGNNFEKFQTIADWLFFANAIFPESLKNASKNYYYSIAQLSYFNCYRIIKQFVIYEVLADNFIPLSTKCGDIILRS